MILHINRLYMYKHKDYVNIAFKYNRLYSCDSLIATFALLQRSRTKPSRSLKYVFISRSTESRNLNIQLFVNVHCPNINNGYKMKTIKYLSAEEWISKI